LRISDPRFLDKRLGLSSATGYSRDYNKEISTFSSEAFYQSITASYNITDRLQHGVLYDIRAESLSPIGKGAKDPSAGTQNDEEVAPGNPVYVESQGKFVTSILGHFFAYDRRDGGFFPNSGYFAQITQKVAGLGGNIFYLEHEARFEQFFALFGIDDSVLSFKLRAKNITGLAGQKVRIKDRFSLGANSGLRGFAVNGVGPKLFYSAPNPDPILSLLIPYLPEQKFNYGGQNLFLGSLEYRFPNFIPKELGISTFIFLDFGTVFGYEAREYGDEVKGKFRIADSKSLRASYGIGLSWRSPLGPISVGYGKAFKYKEFDTRRGLFLSIGGMYL
jgi:outer membrane protein insertion porin family